MTLSPREVVEAPAREWRRYAEYKDSGVDWLSEVPEHWDLKPLRYIFTVVGGSTPSSGVPEYWDGDIPWVTPEDLGQLPSNYVTTTRRQITQAGYESCGTTMVPIGSLIMSTRAPVGHLAIAGKRLCTNQGCKALVLQKSETVRYYYYQLLTGRAEVRSWAQGSTFQELGRNKLGSIELVQPPLAEQQAIAAFLDRETEKIDDLIAKRERLIGLLEEKRTALISRAVTKGLDPNVPMKDSGVEWLGEIPAHWETWKVAHAFRRVGSGTTPTTDELAFYDGDIPWVTTSELRENVINDTSSKLTRRALKQHPTLALYPPGTLLVAMYGATIGRLGILGIPACVNQACCALADPESLDIRFTFYWLLARRTDIIMVSAGGGQPNINQEKIKSLRIPAPPLQEQRSIANSLDEQMIKIDALVSKVQEHIEKLREYRTALISAAVTGKIDVREESGEEG